MLLPGNDVVEAFPGSGDIVSGLRATVRWTMLARIDTFLRNASPNAYCDACLATALGLDRRVVARETALLAKEDRFTRSRDVCTLCGVPEPVIAAR
jgi:hypothetical protein